MIGRILARRMSTLAQPLPKTNKGAYPVPNSPQYRKLQELQTKFCADDGLLVWQKLPKDMFLYRLAIVLVSIGTLQSAYTLYYFTSPPKNN